MLDEIFTGGMALVTFLLFQWSFRHLPEEKWQFVASIPRLKKTEGCWQGLNLTYYGLFNAFAYTLAAAIVILLTCAAGMPLALSLGLIGLVLAVCMPGSRLIARIVENKKHTFSVGGASFLGIMLLPPLLMALHPFALAVWDLALPPMVYLATVAIAYCWGEGIGRLACISFGCCYGKPLAELSPQLQKFFRHWHFIFLGKTRKISYADKLDGVEVVPIQGVTAVLYCLTALISLYLYLKGYFTTAFMLALCVSQLWRFGSEFLRADYRGRGRISAYQYMSLAAVAYGLLVALGCAMITPSADVTIRIIDGLRVFWSPVMLLSIQALWLAAFLYTGRSEVTGSTIEFHVHHHRI
ncbi:MAG: prolipoprotein diacylglyceryl transferase [Desulfobacterales bacterium]|nr:prolipoprotein diacylglyceryl transferase [Desulfobacterales bacterium]